MNWDIYYEIVGILQDEGFHFAFSAILGCAAFLSIVTICYAAFALGRMMSRSNALPPPALNRFIIGLGLCYGLLFAWLAHTGLDYLIYLYNMPLGPSLNLIR